jgi:hypothetical protein
MSSDLRPMTSGCPVAASKAKNEESVDFIADSNIEMRRNGLLCFTIEQMVRPVLVYILAAIVD